MLWLARQYPQPRPALHGEEPAHRSNQQPCNTAAKVLAGGMDDLLRIECNDKKEATLLIGMLRRRVEVVQSCKLRTATQTLNEYCE